MNFVAEELSEFDMAGGFTERRHGHGHGCHGGAKGS